MKKNLHIAGLITLGGLAIFLAGLILGAFVRPYFEGEQILYLVGIAAIILIGAAYTFNNFLQAYVVGTRRLTEETRVIVAANPAHRISFDTPSDVRELATIINTFADRFQAILTNQSQQIQQARAELEEEKNRLAALMSELSEGVLVCNLEGQILLYNNRARQLLRHTPDLSWSSNVGGYIGLGRSIFGLIDRNTINYMLEDLTQPREQQNQKQFSQVVTTATNGQLIRTRSALVLGQDDDLNGFVLTLEDVTEQTTSSRRRDTLLQSLTEGVRSSLANIRSAIETIEQFPEMDVVKLAQLRKIIYDESLTLSSRLNQVATEYDADLNADWQLEEMLGKDLLWAIQHRFEENLKVETTIAEQDENLWLKVDSFPVVQGMLYIMRRLRDEFNINAVSLYLKKSGHLAALDLAWQNKDVDLDTIWTWQNASITPSVNNGASLTLREIVERHGGEIWCQTDKTSDLTYIRLLLATTQPKASQAMPVAQKSRPEYYDFDLFQQPGQTPELDQRQLTELTYTVFDTETTGLDPTGGDEIISISAVRIVNGRLLRHEIFDQLVDPKRPLPLTSTDITGISAEMLKGQPTIEQVLPSMHKFAEGTVLVAHNAAFDMRLLQLKETQTGVKFTNPVLDTLLISAITHANQSDHSLEAIALRLGVTIIGRHTSLGDAILTGEIFLKLIPLLNERGILTLAEAREAAQQTYMARLSY